MTYLQLFGVSHYPGVGFGCAIDKPTTPARHTLSLQLLDPVDAQTRRAVLQILSSQNELDIDRGYDFDYDHGYMIYMA